MLNKKFISTLVFVTSTFALGLCSAEGYQAITAQASAAYLLNFTPTADIDVNANSLIICSFPESTYIVDGKLTLEFTSDEFTSGTAARTMGKRDNQNTVVFKPSRYVNNSQTTKIQIHVGGSAAHNFRVKGPDGQSITTKITCRYWSEK